MTAIVLLLATLCACIAYIYARWLRAERRRIEQARAEALAFLERGREAYAEAIRLRLQVVAEQVRGAANRSYPA